MKLLLDECVPQRLKNDFTGHDVYTVGDVGLTGVKNGQLLNAAAERFDVLITVDRRMPFQQNLSGLDLAVIILIATPCRYSELKLLAPKVVEVLSDIRPGEVLQME